MKKILRYILPLVYILYAGCISMCYHTHVVDGVRIVHSHPFSDDAQHSHTEAELSLINDIAGSTFTDFVPSGLVLSLFVILLAIFLSPRQDNTFFSDEENINPLRGPPSFIYC